RYEITCPFFGISLRLLMPFPNFSGQLILLQRLRSCRVPADTVEGQTRLSVESVLGARRACGVTVSASRVASTCVRRHHLPPCTPRMYSASVRSRRALAAGRAVRPGGVYRVGHAALSSCTLSVLTRRPSRTTHEPGRVPCGRWGEGRRMGSLLAGGMIMAQKNGQRFLSGTGTARRRGVGVPVRFPKG
ncbi:MAG: hypothetical protein H6Q85_2804, partial [candidate division NC10 bacterium]|nr:hypothetical protein [candidate division NC10 bacterium]